MKHPLHKFSKKNRNIISGVLVGVATIFAVTNYFNVPREEIVAFLVGTAMFLVGIILLAIIAVVILKALGKLKDFLLKK